MKPVHLVGPAMLASILAAAGCSSSSKDVTAGGGTSSPGTNSGGSSSGGSSSSTSTVSSGGSVQPSNCTDVSPCGGDIVGTWKVESSCLNVTGTMDPTLASMSCSSAPVTGTRTVTGTLTVGPNGTYTDDTAASGTQQFTLASGCLIISSTPIACDQAGRAFETLGFSALNCASAAGGGCDCSGSVQQTGGVGIIPFFLSSTGTYTTSNNVVTLRDATSSSAYSYCVSGDRMTWTPKSTNPTLKGTVVFQRQGVGAGGATGSGGNTSVGGATSSTSGGQIGAGGATGAGGAGGRSNAGGAPGAGGNGDGGRTGAGGATGTGGRSNSGGSTSNGGSNSSGGASTIGTRPCDIFATANTPCVAAHSTVRSLFASYDKPLYQVRKVSDNTTKDIPLLASAGIADAAVQDAFCSTTSRACTISIIYDQTGNGNDLKVAQTCPTCSGCPADSTKKGQPDVEAFADLAKITIAGHTAYGVRILPCGNGIPNQTGYRVQYGKKTATGDQPESMYFVVDGVNTNGGCCFDYGNASTTLTAAGNMNAIEFSKNKYWGYGAGSGPWVAADLEAGVYAWNGGSGNWMNPNSTSLAFPFVTALLKNNQNGLSGGPFVLKGGDSRSGSLTTMWDGARPNGYATLKKQGGIVLGIGGDNAAGAAGSFFEGAITASFNSSASDDALQANIVAAGYGK